VGQGFGGFLDLCEKVFFLIQYPGAVLPPAGQVIKKNTSQNRFPASITKPYVLHFRMK
jgi:hypothetical protein